MQSAFYPLTLAVDGWLRMNLRRGDFGCKLDPPRWTLLRNNSLPPSSQWPPVALSILLCYGLADQLARVIRKTGMIGIVRISSFLLVCIGVQIMWNGITAQLSTLRV